MPHCKDLDDQFGVHRRHRDIHLLGQMVQRLEIFQPLLLQDQVALHSRDRWHSDSIHCAGKLRVRKRTRQYKAVRYILPSSFFLGNFTSSSGDMIISRNCEALAVGVVRLV